MINRISTTHIKEGQPGGKYYENQKEEQTPVCGEPDFSYPKGRTVPLIPQPQECRQTGFVLSPVPPAMPPFSCSLQVSPRVASVGPERCQELPARLCGSTGQDVCRARKL